MEHCSTRVAFQIDCSFVRADDPFSDCQPKAGSADVGGYKGLKDVRLNIVRDTRSGICHNDFILRWNQVLCRVYYADIQGSAFFLHRLRRVADQIDKNLLKCAEIRFYQGMFWVRVKIIPDIQAGRRGAHRSKYSEAFPPNPQARKWYSIGFENCQR